MCKRQFRATTMITKPGSLALGQTTEGAPCPSPSPFEPTCAFSISPAGTIFSIRKLASI